MSMGCVTGVQQTAPRSRFRPGQCRLYCYRTPPQFPKILYRCGACLVSFVHVLVLAVEGTGTVTRVLCTVLTRRRHLPSPLSRGQPRSPLSGPVDAASALHGSGRSMVHVGRRRSTAHLLPNGLSEGAHTIMLGAGKFNDPNASAFGASNARAMRRNATTMGPRMQHGQAAGNHWQHHVNHLHLTAGRPNSGSRLQHETHGSLATVFSGDLQVCKRIGAETDVRRALAVGNWSCTVAVRYGWDSHAPVHKVVRS